MSSQLCWMAPWSVWFSFAHGKLVVIFDMVFWTCCLYFSMFISLVQDIILSTILSWLCSFKIASLCFMLWLLLSIAFNTGSEAAVKNRLACLPSVEVPPFAQTEFTKSSLRPVAVRILSLTLFLATSIVCLHPSFTDQTYSGKNWNKGFIYCCNLVLIYKLIFSTYVIYFSNYLCINIYIYIFIYLFIYLII